jgi:pimeloyl-ACP methyl ester carboxylesterase
VAAADDEIRTEWVEGGELRFEVLACGDAASPRLALCLHGFPELAWSWRHQLPLLARLGYKVWAPNQRGYGRTTRPRGRRAYRIERLLEDVAHLIDASGCREVTLLGHDWGGIVAWYVALRGIHPLERLVVMNIPHPRRMREVLASSWAQRRRSWYVLFFQLPWLPEALLRAGHARAVGEAFRGMAVDKSRFSDDVLEVYRRAALEPGALTAMLNWYRANLRLLDDAEQLRQLDVPTLMLWGERDRALGVELTEGTERLVRDFTLRRLPGVSHWVQQEAPETVNAMLEAWLRGEPVPEAPLPRLAGASAAA